MGLVHIYCGDGKGKTTAAMGLAVRAAGSGKRVLVVQFMKCGNSSELKVLEQIPGIRCLFSPVNYGFIWNMQEKEKQAMRADYTALFRKAAEQAGEVDLLVLDEMVSAYTCDMVERSEVLALLDKKTAGPELVLTGRDPAPELQERADYITRMEKVRHPFDQGMDARKGIEF